MPKLVLTAIAFVFYVSVVNAQTKQEDCRYTLTGKVVDAQTNAPLPKASINVNKNALHRVADEEGVFNVNNLCKDKIVITIEVVGYQTLQHEIGINGDKTILFPLLAKSVSLEEIRVTGQKKSIETTSAITTIRQEQLDQKKGGSLGEILQSVPGVNILQTGATITKPVIQGLHSNRILILNNGIRQEGQQWGAEHAPEIDPFVANRITVVKGAEGIRFGPEAIGGVILVEPPALPTVAGLHGDLNFAGASNGRSGVISGMLNGGIKKLPGFGWRIQGTAKKSGNVKTGKYYLNNTGTSEINFSGALGYSNEHVQTELYISHVNSELGIFSGAHIGNVEDLTARIENGKPFEDGEFSYAIQAPRQKVAHDLLKLKAHFPLNPKTKLNMVYGLQRNKREEYDMRRAGRSDIPSLDMTLISQTFNLFAENKNDRGWKKIIGIDGLIQVNNNVPGTYAIPLIPNYDSYGAGAYFIGKLTKNKYQLESGIRYDYKYLDALGFNREQELTGGTRHFNNFSASLGGIFHLNQQWSISSNLGSAWRPPVVSELYSDGIHHGAAAYEKGNAALKSEQGYKWITTAEYKGNPFRLELSIYANLITNYIYLNPSGKLYENMRGVFPSFDYEQTNAFFTGIDWLGGYQLSTAFDYELKVSIVHAKDIYNQKYLPWIPSDRIENSLRWKAVKEGKAGKTFVQLQHQLVAKQHRYNEGSDYASPPGVYQLLNLNAGAQWKIGDNTLILNLSVNNVTNLLYKEYMNRFRYYAHDTGRNFMVRATWRF